MMPMVGSSKRNAGVPSTPPQSDVTVAYVRTGDSLGNQNVGKSYDSYE